MWLINTSRLRSRIANTARFVFLKRAVMKMFFFFLRSPLACGGRQVRTDQDVVCSIKRKPMRMPFGQCELSNKPSLVLLRGVCQLTRCGLNFQCRVVTKARFEPAQALDVMINTRQRLPSVVRMIICSYK